MIYRNERIMTDPGFPFAVFYGEAFSREEWDQGRAFMHCHNSLEINYCVNGSGVYEIGESVYPISCGDFIIINNLEYHRALNASGDFKLMVIVFDAEMVLSGSEDYALLRAFYEWKSEFKHMITSDAPVLEKIRPLLFEMDSEWMKRDSGYRMIIKADLTKMLAVVYREFENTGGNAEKVAGFMNGCKRLAPALHLIDSDFSKPLTLEELAGAVHMNKNYFSTVFSGVMGCPVSEYIVKRRLKHAAQKLIGTEDSVLSIALDSGFRSVPYFNRAFRKQFGISPTQYRKQSRGNE